MVDSRQPIRVLQLCHHYRGPFLDVARQYVSLFAESEAEITTVFLHGKPDPAVKDVVGGSSVAFLDLDIRDIRGLKRKPVRFIRTLAAEKQFDLCFAHRYHAINIATHVKGLPVFGVHHRFGTYQRWERRFYVNRHKRSLTLLGVSNAVRDETRLHFPAWSAGKIQTLYNHVDISALRSRQVSRDVARRRLGLDDGAWVLANVGRLHKDKDQKTLISGFARALPGLPANSMLVIYGDGPLKTQLQEQAHELGVTERIVFGGFVKGMAENFRAFDAFVLTSDHEPFGMVLLEAMVAEVPVICSDCGGGAEVVGDAGLLFDFGDEASLADSISTLRLMSADARQELTDRQVGRVVACFSDQAVRESFWKRFMSRDMA